MATSVSHERIERILDRLSKGSTRDDLAKEFGHRNRQSVDQYMRRHGYVWDSSQGNYRLRSDKSSNQRIVPTKAIEVIAEFKKPNADAREIAKRLHFAHHHEMAKYMQARGYVWSSEVENYVSRNGASSPDNLDNGGAQADSLPFQAGDYLHILSLLLRNEDKLTRLLDQTVTQQTEIPRYILPGVYTVKSIHMVAELDQLVKTFSREKNISQREIFEVALIHFFKQYGFGATVDSLFHSEAAASL
ncbi:hypothetical protein LLE49_27100 [Alicyclobacillus tolerans]|uniref:hypothetical protein n=1 Tax=Alicyclobacillus tolerans TaxID=90970 RepID=UPI001F1C1069|nr:hypothetical protein [Alicyclobacillus tolerans]MCF8568390.1 hypothetical protein [Alicyclobacillus tolerans]